MDTALRRLLPVAFASIALVGTACAGSGSHLGAGIGVALAVTE